MKNIIFGVIATVFVVFFGNSQTTLINEDPNFIELVSIRDDMSNQLKRNLDNNVFTTNDVKRIINSGDEVDILRLYSLNPSSFTIINNRIVELKSRLLDDYPTLAQEVENARNCVTCNKDLNVVVDNLDKYISSSKAAGCKWMQFSGCLILATETGPGYPIAAYLCYCSYCADKYNICF